jgi:hypothetical protein
LSRTNGSEALGVSTPLIGRPLPAPNSSASIRRPQRVVRADWLGAEIKLTIDPNGLCTVFGIDDLCVVSRRLSQLVSVIQPDPRKPADASLIDGVLALIEGIGPADTVEAMTASSAPNMPRSRPAGVWSGCEARRSASRRTEN